MAEYNKLKNNGLELGAIGQQIGENLLSNVTGVVSVLPTAKYTSGARVKLSINGELVGFAFGVSWNVSTTVSEIRSIDDYLPQELAPKHVSVTGTLSMLHIPGEGPSISAHQSNVLNFLHQKYITIEVRDSATDNLLFFTNKAMVISRAETIQAEQLGTIQLEWRAIGWKDELDPVPPQSRKKQAEDKANRANSKIDDITKTIEDEVSEKLSRVRGLIP